MNLSLNPQIITLTNSNELEINFDSLFTSLKATTGGEEATKTALVDWIAGAPKFSSTGATITNDSGGVTTEIRKLLLPIDKGVPIKVKGTANDSFQVTILND